MRYESPPTQANEKTYRERRVERGGVQERVEAGWAERGRSLTTQTMRVCL